MFQSMFVSCLALFFLTTSLVAEQPAWKLVNENAAFAPRDSCGEVVYKDRLWILGGWMNSFKDPPRDVWSSGNGKCWFRPHA